LVLLLNDLTFFPSPISIMQAAGSLLSLCYYPDYTMLDAREEVHRAAAIDNADEQQRAGKRGEQIALRRALRGGKQQKQKQQKMKNKGGAVRKR
jgi:hypothetical protein